MVSDPPCGLPMTKVRVVGPTFGATFSVTVPLPVPDAPDTTVTAVGSLFVIVQSQPAPAIKLTGKVPPPLGTEELLGLKEL